MKVFVIGAAGRTGKAIVERALAAGHQVTALSRDTGDAEVPGVRIVRGDATESSVVGAAVCKQDAVIDTIGGKAPYRATTLELSVAKTVPSVPMTMRHRPPGSLALRVLKDDPAHAHDTDPDRR